MPRPASDRPASRARRALSRRCPARRARPTSRYSASLAAPVGDAPM
jgi:hypothetical protein